MVYTMGVRMYQGQSNQPKKKLPTYVGDNILESVRGIGTNIGKTVQHDVVSQISQDALQAIFNTNQRKNEELPPNEAVQFQPERQQKPIIRGNELIQQIKNADQQEVKAKIDAVRKELQSLSKSIQGLQQEIQSAVMDMPVEAGIYHVNFFEQLRQMLFMMRQQVDNSRVWLEAFQANSKKKRGYWGKYKKHGTLFGLSNERTVATQSG
jgi:hypothetical protein